MEDCALARIDDKNDVVGVRLAALVRDNRLSLVATECCGAERCWRLDGAEEHVKEWLREEARNAGLTAARAAVAAVAGVGADYTCAADVGTDDLQLKVLKKGVRSKVVLGEGPKKTVSLKLVVGAARAEARAAVLDAAAAAARAARAERSALAARVDALERRAADLEATDAAHRADVDAAQQELLAEFARRLAASNARAAELELRAAGTRPDDDKSDGEETDEDEKRTRREGKPDVARGLLAAAGSGATVMKSEDLMQTLTQQATLDDEDMGGDFSMGGGAPPPSPPPPPRAPAPKRPAVAAEPSAEPPAKRAKAKKRRGLLDSSDSDSDSDAFV